MADTLMSVNSVTLTAGAEQLRKTVGDKPALLRNGARANATQLDRAAEILRDADPSIITHVNGRKVQRDPQERPGYIDAEQQDRSGALTFSVGILPSTTYRIHRDGSLQVVDKAGNLTPGDTFYGVKSGRTDGYGSLIESVKRTIQGRIQVTFDGGIVRTYEPGRSVVRAPRDGGSGDTP